MANHMRPEKKRAILHALCEGCSVRSVERMTGVHRDSILRLLVRTGEYCESIMEREIDGIYTNSVQCDELWTFVHTKAKRVKPSDPQEYGDAYVWIALDSETKAVLAYHVGRRDGQSGFEFV